MRHLVSLNSSNVLTALGGIAILLTASSGGRSKRAAEFFQNGNLRRCPFNPNAGTVDFGRCEDR